MTKFLQFVTICALCRVENVHCYCYSVHGKVAWMLVIDRRLSSREDRRLVQWQISCNTEAWLGTLLNRLALLGPPVCTSLLCALYLLLIVCSL